MSKALDQIAEAVATKRSVDTAVAELLEQISAQLKNALANEDTGAIAVLAEDLRADPAKVQEAVTRNTAVPQHLASELYPDPSLPPERVVPSGDFDIEAKYPHKPAAAVAAEAKAKAEEDRQVADDAKAEADKKAADAKAEADKKAAADKKAEVDAKAEADAKADVDAAFPAKSTKF